MGAQGCRLHPPPPSGIAIILQTECHACWVDVTDGLALTPDVDFVVVILCGFAVHWVVEVHALGVLAPPVAPDQVSAGAEQSDDHDRNDYPQNSYCDVVTYEVVITRSSVGEVGIALFLNAVGSHGSQ